MSNPTCETCRFFEAIEEEGFRPGKCHRYPPRVSDALLRALTEYMASEVGSNEPETDPQEIWERMGVDSWDPSNTVWPVVDLDADPWCGEHQPKPEEKE